MAAAQHFPPRTPRTRARRRPPAGFTLLELIVVVALIAACTALATLALPDGDRSVLEKDAQRLAALLEAARAESRASGRPVFWRALDGGFRFEGRAAAAPSPGQAPTAAAQRAPLPWLDSQVQVASGPASMMLGPEPMLPPQGIILARGHQRLQVASDGVRPFAVVQVP